MTVQFTDFTPEETVIVKTIVERAVAAYDSVGLILDPVDMLMDLSAVQATCPLQLANLLEANDFNFNHDIAGIRKHLDRSTGYLTRGFLPRFAKPEVPHVDTSL